MAEASLDHLFQSLTVRSENDDLSQIFDAVVNMFRQWEQWEQCRQREDEQTIGSLKDRCLTGMAEMSQVYRHLRHAQSTIDFSAQVTQWAYMYLFMLRHIHLVLYSLGAAFDYDLIYVNPLGRTPKMCMIGGGPCSDLLGVSLFLRRHGLKTPHMHQVYLLDRCVDWAWSWENLNPLLPHLYRVPRVNYSQFDYRNKYLSATNQQIIFGAELITMIKSLSPVAAELRKIKTSFEIFHGRGGRLFRRLSEWHSVFSILNHMRPGACLLYIDNETGPHRDILLETLQFFHVRIIFHTVLRDVSLPTDSFSSNAREFIDDFGYRPCTLAGTNEVILLQKMR